MNRYIAVIPLVMAACAGAQEQAPPATPRLSIEISAPKETFAVGAPIALDLTVTNVSDRDLTWTMSVLRGVRLRLLDIKVWDAEGKIVPETEFGATVHRRHPSQWGANSSAVWFSVAPHHSTSEKADLAKEFDLAAVGTYTVQAFGVDAANRLAVKSNVLTFRIVR